MSKPNRHTIRVQRTMEAHLEKALSAGTSGLGTRHFHRGIRKNNVASRLIPQEPRFVAADSADELHGDVMRLASYVVPEGGFFANIHPDQQRIDRFIGEVGLGTSLAVESYGGHMLGTPDITFATETERPDRPVGIPTTRAPLNAHTMIVAVRYSI